MPEVRKVTQWSKLMPYKNFGPKKPLATNLLSIDNFKKILLVQTTSKKIMGINNLVIMGIKNLVIYYYGNRQLDNIFMGFELWDQNTPKLWVSKSFR